MTLIDLCSAYMAAISFLQDTMLLQLCLEGMVPISVKCTQLRDLMFIINKLLTLINICHIIAT